MITTLLQHEKTHNTKSLDRFTMMLRRIFWWNCWLLNWIANQRNQDSISVPLSSYFSDLRLEVSHNTERGISIGEIHFNFDNRLNTEFGYFQLQFNCYEVNYDLNIVWKRVVKNPGVDTGASRMRIERSTIWASSPTQSNDIIIGLYFIY